MKRCRKLLLAAMLAWLLLFLSVLSHFLELPSAVAPRARSSAASGPSLSRTEIRRLASIQGGGGGGGKPGTPRSSTPSSGPPGSLVPRGEALNGDTQSAAWAAGLRAEGGRKQQPPGQRRVKGDWSPEVEEDWEERRRRRKLRIRMKRARRWSRRRGGAGGGTAKRAENGEDEEDEGDYFVSRSKAVVQKLWKGDASADMLSGRLQKALKDYLSTNKHHVAYSGQRRPRQSGHQVLCELKRRARLRTLDGTEEPFASLGWARLVPPRPLDKLPPGSEFKTCAVVTSAGAILNSSLGAEIDSHDAVLRFNAAPTKGFEKDVGNRTTIRIINSQIVARPRHNFNASSLYQDVTLVAWDPAPYSVDLPKWFENPDYDLFTPYSERRLRRPDQPFYILHPAFIWNLWDVIQANTQENIQPNPPSSGFIVLSLDLTLQLSLK